MNTSPYEKLYMRKPSLLHFRIFGYLCYPKILNQTDKSQSKSKKDNFFELFRVLKGLLSIWFITNKFYIHREVIFKETEFIFIDKIVEQPLFCSTDPLVFEEVHAQSQYSTWLNDTNFYSVLGFNLDVSLAHQEDTYHTSANQGQ